MDFRNLNKKQIRKMHAWVRGIIQLVFFILMPSAFTAAFNGVKYIFTQIGAGDSIEITSFVSVLIVLCIYTFVFGRFFCGFACAFGSLGDAVHALYILVCKKLKKKPVKLPKTLTDKLSALKYIVLTVIVLLCFAGVYGNLRGTSPWDVFSMLRAGNFQLSGYPAGVVLLILLIAGMCLQERFFCRFFCPMGAVFSILPVLPFFALQRDRENCLKGCSACTRTCPSDILLPPEGIAEVRGDCFQCQKCIDTCPKGNIHTGIGFLKGNEVIFTVVRAVILLGLMMWIGL